MTLGAQDGSVEFRSRRESLRLIEEARNRVWHGDLDDLLLLPLVLRGRCRRWSRRVGREHLGQLECEERHRAFELLEELRVLFSPRREFRLSEYKGFSNLGLADELDEAQLEEVKVQCRIAVEDLEQGEPG
jgi:hypothetical protein